MTPNGSAVLAWRQSADPKRLNANQLVVSARAPGAARLRTGQRPQRRAHGSEPVVGGRERPRRRGRRLEPLWPSLGVCGLRPLPRPARGLRAAGEAQPHARHGRPLGDGLPNGRMVLGWTDNIKRRAEARVRLASGKLGPVKKVTEDLEQNSDLFALAFGRGALAWSDRDPDVSTLRIADTAADGRFLAPRTVTRFRGWTVGPAFAVAPQGPVAVASRRCARQTQFAGYGSRRASGPSPAPTRPRPTAPASTSSRATTFATATRSNARLHPPHRTQTPAEILSPQGLRASTAS